MKYIVLIIDGAADLPLPQHGGKTSLELARTPNLDTIAVRGLVGLSHNVPAGFEPDSAVACMSIFGYDPILYYAGRAPIEAVSMGIPMAPGEVLFRCNLVTIQKGIMVSHSSGAITTEEAHSLIETLNQEIGNEHIHIFPGTGYRSIMKIKNAAETAAANCTPPHDIPGRPVADYLPQNRGSTLLIDLMKRSESILKKHQINKKRIVRGDLPATSIWLFWGSGQTKPLPPFFKIYGKTAAVTSGVNLLQGLGKMTGMTVLHIPGVTDGLDNNYAAQASGALDALNHYDIVIVHIESPDEAGHAGSVEDKVAAIEKIDAEVVSKLGKWQGGDLKLFITADHPTPVSVRTHTGDPVPFIIWGKNVTGNGAVRMTEKEAGKTGFVINPGYRAMRTLLGD